MHPELKLIRTLLGHSFSSSSSTVGEGRNDKLFAGERAQREFNPTIHTVNNIFEFVETVAPLPAGNHLLKLIYGGLCEVGVRYEFVRISSEDVGPKQRHAGARKL